ncbi:MAG: VOC family protein [Acidobacteria bacterium]|nr:VOC family protein [Acidobacteriota bacterium]
MGNSAGSFIWYELMTTDPDAAARFYGAVIGWHIGGPDPNSPGGMDYRMIGRTDGRPAGGVLKITPDMGGVPSTWLGYLHAADVDATTAAIKADGGNVYMPPRDVPGAGRISMVTDPQGIPFYVMTPTPPPEAPDMVSDVFAPRTPQRVNWNELTTPDLAAAKAFYGKHFNFQFNETMSMGPMGDYGFIDHDGVRLGGIVQRMDPQQPIGWLYYFGVPSVGAAKDAIEANGGRVIMGPHQVPTGESIVIAVDPTGAAFAVVGPA